MGEPNLCLDLGVVRPKHPRIGVVVIAATLLSERSRLNARLVAVSCVCIVKILLQGGVRYG